MELLIILAVLALYMLAWFVAVHRNHHQRSAIAVLTMFFGWTFLGWVIALVWASTAVRTDH